MTPQALALAFAASIYPPAVAAVIALGRGADVRPRVFVFVLASLLITYVVGALILYLLVEVGATGSRHLTPSAGVDIALGALLLWLALRLHMRRPSPLAAVAARIRRRRGGTEGEVGTVDNGIAAGERTLAASREGAPGEEPGTGEERQNGGSKIERYLHSRRLAFTLGIVLYVLPSPIYIGAVKSIADANSSTAAELTSLVVVVAIMLWMIELPMVLLLAFPTQAVAGLEGVNRWFARNGRSLGVVAAVGVGVYLIVKGITQLS
jgi:Sap, sulfolipid-1-addressing protein